MHKRLRVKALPCPQDIDNYVAKECNNNTIVGVGGLKSLKSLEGVWRLNRCVFNTHTHHGAVTHPVMGVPLHLLFNIHVNICYI